MSSNIAGYLIHDGDKLVGTCRNKATADSLRAKGLRVTAVFYDRD